MSKKGLVIVGGGASGIGLACIRCFVEEGYTVCSFDRSRPLPGELLALPRVSALRVDLEDEQGLAEAIEEATADAPLRHLVCLAGRINELERDSQNSGAPLPPPAAFAESFRDNFLSAYYLLHACLPALAATAAQGEDCSVTLMSSLSALGGYRTPAYSSTKAALHGLAYSAAAALGERGVRINVVAAGLTRTTTTEAVFEYLFDSPEEGSRKIKEVGAAFPLGRVSEPEHVADAVLSLATLTQVTGHVLVVDGGQALSRR